MCPYHTTNSVPLLVQHRVTPPPTPTPTPPRHIIQQVKFPFFLLSSSIIYSLFRSLTQISMASYTWGRGSLTDTSLGVAVSVPAPPLEQGCLPEESAHGNTNSPNSSSGTNSSSGANNGGVLAALPEFMDAIDSVRTRTRPPMRQFLRSVRDMPTCNMSHFLDN